MWHPLNYSISIIACHGMDLQLNTVAFAVIFVMFFLAELFFFLFVLFFGWHYMDLQLNAVADQSLQSTFEDSKYNQCRPSEQTEHNQY